MSFNPDNRQLGQIKFALFAICLLPALRLLWAAYTDDFGAEPEEFVQRWTGTWTFNLLLITLCVFCFFYATLHLLSFIGFDHGFLIDEIAKDISKRPFVTVGFAAFLLLIPLAATSNNLAIRKLGGRKWQELHRNIYLISILACVHYFWLSKANALMWPLAYSLAVAALLGWRVRERKRKAVPVPQIQGVKPLTFFKKKPD